MKAALYGYLIVSLAMVATSLVTGRRATILTGEPHYLLTRASVMVEREVEPRNVTDAALNAIFKDAGESTMMTVEEPVFVLGLLDATGPIVAGSGIVLLWLWRRDRRRRTGVGTGPKL